MTWRQRLLQATDRSLRGLAPFTKVDRVDAGNFVGCAVGEVVAKRKKLFVVSRDAIRFTNMREEETFNQLGQDFNDAIITQDVPWALKTYTKIILHMKEHYPTERS